MKVKTRVYHGEALAAIEDNYPKLSEWGCLVLLDPDNGRGIYFEDDGILIPLDRTDWVVRISPGNLELHNSQTLEQIYEVSDA